MRPRTRQPCKHCCLPTLRTAAVTSHTTHCTITVSAAYLRGSAALAAESGATAILAALIAVCFV